MNKVLYLTMAPIDESSGVYKKILAQSKSLCRNGFSVKILFVRDSGIAYFREINGDLQTIDLKDKNDIGYICSYLKESTFCYSRFELLRHNYFRKILFLCRKHNINIISEIPTYPPYQESFARVKDSFSKKKYFAGMKTLLGTIFVVLDVYITVLFSKLMVLVADDKKFIFGNSIRIENGVDVDNVILSDRKKDNVINIVGVSNFSVWNGYDRAIRGLKNYIQSTGLHNVKLIFVGDKISGKSLIDMSEEMGVSNDVLFTGALSGTALDDAYQRADLALCALGNHRRKVFANSSLKAKEYASHGMLMIMSDAEGIENEIKEKSFVVDSDESPIDFKSIVEWFKNNECINEDRSYIYAFARDHYSWDFQMKKVINAINKLS